MALEKILIPIDFSHNSKSLVQYAKEFNEKFKSEIHFLHVLDKRSIMQAPIDYMYPELSINIIDEKLFSESIYRNAESLINKFKKEFNLNDNSFIFKIEWGIPYSKIIEYSEENNINLIIIGSHGTSGIKHLLLGSVVDYVVHHSKIPVLVVKVK